MSTASDKARRVDLGFAGGQVLALRMKRAIYDGLRKALEPADRGGWHVLETEDSQVAVDLAQVVYVRLDTEEHKVGF